MLLTLRLWRCKSNLAAFCRHCGNAIGEGVEKCNHCGALLNGQHTSHNNGNLPQEPVNKLPETSPEDLLAQAMKLADEGAYDDAILVCRRAIALKGDFVAAYAFLGGLYERVGEKEKAMAAYEKALSLDKDYEPAKLAKERLEKEPAPVQAQIPTTPEDEGGWVWSGHPLPLLGATALVVGLLFAVRMVIPPVPKPEPISPQHPITLAPSTQIRSAPSTAPPLPAAVEVALKRGMEALNAQKYDEAIRWFERALQFAPNNNEARSWLLIARAMKEEAQERRRPPVVAARPEPTSLPVLPLPQSQRQTSPSHQVPSRQPSTSEEPQLKQQQSSTQPQAAQTLPWQQGWWYPTSPGLQPPQPQVSPFIVPSQRPVVPNIPQSPALPSPSERPPAINPATGSTPSTPPLPPSIEELERQAAQKVYEGDFAAAAQIYRTILSRGVGVEREGYIRQQLALALQQLRKYDDAAEEYENAISAYKRQIEMGVNVAAAQRGIEACQRGLEICKRAR